MKKGLVKNIILTAIGVFIIYWAIEHRPDASLGQMIDGILDDTSYRMSEAWYYTSLIVGGIIALLGLKGLLK